MDLSIEQSKAVLAESQKALVIAGAGSGKTRVLISRINHLIGNCHVSPHEILAFTFTRKAAGEMRSRLKKVIGDKANDVTIGTMHGTALDFLQRFGELVGLKTKRITVYSEWEEKFLLKDVCMELGYHSGKAWKGVKKKDVDRAFYLFYTEGKRDPELDTANDILDAFFARCKENNALTYGTIMTTFQALLPHIKNFLGYRHVLVDETQDNDKLQWQIINTLCELSGASLFACGDIDQAIFAFRGADPGYLIRHKPEFDVYTLEDNYRSDGNIVQAANALIEHNQSRIKKTMNAKKDSVVTVSCFESMDSGKIAANIQNYRENFSENMAVLARNHFMLEKLSKLLNESGIEHEYVGKQKALTKSEGFRRFHAFLKLVINPYDNFSFLLIRDYVGVTKKEYGEIRLKAVQENKSHFQAWIDFDDPEDAGTWAKTISPCRSDEMHIAVDLLKNIEFEFDPEPVFEFVYAWLLENSEKTIEDYLNWLAVYDLQDEISDKPKSLQLMTVHASKGLEFPTVIIAGMNEGILPSNRANSNDDELEGERRLAYVAYTRAENLLLLTSRPTQDSRGFEKHPVSRFVKEGLE